MTPSSSTLNASCQLKWRSASRISKSGNVLLLVHLFLFLQEGDPIRGEVIIQRAELARFRLVFWLLIQERLQSLTKYLPPPKEYSKKPTISQQELQPSLSFSPAPRLHPGDERQGSGRLEERTSPGARRANLSCWSGTRSGDVWKVEAVTKRANHLQKRVYLRIMEPSTRLRGVAALL